MKTKVKKKQVMSRAIQMIGLKFHADDQDLELKTSKQPNAVKLGTDAYIKKLQDEMKKKMKIEEEWKASNNMAKDSLLPKTKTDLIMQNEMNISNRAQTKIINSAIGKKSIVNRELKTRNQKVEISKTFVPRPSTQQAHFKGKNRNRRIIICR